MDMLAATTCDMMNWTELNWTERKVLFTIGNRSHCHQFQSANQSTNQLFAIESPICAMIARPGVFPADRFLVAALLTSNYLTPPMIKSSDCQQPAQVNSSFNSNSIGKWSSFSLTQPPDDAVHIQLGFDTDFEKYEPGFNSDLIKLKTMNWRVDRRSNISSFLGSFIHKKKRKKRERDHQQRSNKKRKRGKMKLSFFLF